jgi:hypothetical protein
VVVSKAHWNCVRQGKRQSLFAKGPHVVLLVEVGTIRFLVVIYLNTTIVFTKRKKLLFHGIKLKKVLGLLG